jgi:hypothetical protein
MGQPMEQTTQHVAKTHVAPDFSGSCLDFASDYPGVMVALVAALFGIVMYLVKLKRRRS